MPQKVRASAAGLKLIDAARHKKNWNKTEQTWLDMAQVSRSTMNRFWSGKDRIRRENFEQICQAVGVDWQQVVEGEILPDAIGFTLPEKIAPVRHWVGRSQELDTLKSHVIDTETRTITITAVCVVGLAGIGKTTLASQLMRQLHTENAAFVAAGWESLRSVTGKPPRFDNIMDSLLLSLSSGEIAPATTVLDDYHQKIDRLTKLLQQRPCLLVLDNVETVLQIKQAKQAGYFADECAEYAELFQQLAEREHRSKIIFTSRETLAQLTHQRGTQTLKLGGLDRESAVKLLQSFELTATPEAFLELATRYEGHPKALEIVSAVIEEDFQGNVERFLRDRTWLLIRDLESLIDEVVNRLSQEEHTCLSQISVYQTSEYQLSEDGIAAQMPTTEKRDLTENIILALKRRHLLDYNAEGKSYQMHPLVQEKASYLLDADATRNAHRQAYQHFVEITKPEAQWQDVEDIQPLLQAFYHACQAEDWQNAAIAVSRASESLLQKGYYDQVIKFYGDLDLDKLVNFPEVYLDVLCQLGLAYSYLGKCKIADRYLQDGLSIAKKIGDRQREANLLCQLGHNHEVMGDYQVSLRLLEDCVNLATELEDEKLKYEALKNLGTTRNSIGDIEIALEIFKQTLEIARSINFPEGEANALGEIGSTYNLLGEYELAIRHVKQQLEQGNLMNNPVIKSYALVKLGFIHKDMKDYPKVIEFAQELLGVARETGDKHRENSAVNLLGMAYRDLGDYEKAIPYFEQNIKIAGEIGAKRSQGDAYCGLGIAYRKAGKLDRAIDTCKNALKTFQELRVPANEARALIELVRACLERKNVAIKTLQSYLQRAEKIGTDLGLPLLTEVQKLNSQILLTPLNIKK